MHLASKNPFSLPEEVVSVIDSFSSPVPSLVCGCGRVLLGIEERKPKGGRVAWKELGGKLHLVDEAGDKFRLDPCLSPHPFRAEDVETGSLSGWAGEIRAGGRRYLPSCEKYVMLNAYHVIEGDTLCSPCWKRRTKLRTFITRWKKTTK